jgi:peptidoglycan/LPS O-acetylase OafA/YrhL
LSANQAIPSLEAILSHFLIIHNLNQDWAFAINGPMWSVATEWQIYFLFPALLLPVYRRFGIISVVVIAFIVGLSPSYLLSGWSEYAACPWFLGLFALGMAGASINFSKKASIIRWKKRIPWKLLTAILWISLIGKATVFPGSNQLDISKSVSCLAGVATASLIIYCTHSLTEGNAKHRHLILQLFESRYAIALGTFSYSLYLIHAPIIVLFFQFLLSQQISSSVTFLYMVIGAVPLSIAISYIFHLNFEKQFMSSGRKANTKVVF